MSPGVGEKVGFKDIVFNANCISCVTKSEWHWVIKSKSSPFCLLCERKAAQMLQNSDAQVIKMWLYIKDGALIIQNRQEECALGIILL